MNDSKNKPVKLPQARKALRKNAEGHFVVDSHEILDGAVKVIRDVQMLARHSSLQMTQRYIEADVEAQRKVVQLI